MELTQKLAMTVPELILMVLFVKMFLSAMAQRDAAFLATIQQINSENINARKESRETIKENTEHLEKTASAMIMMTNSLHSLADGLKTHLTHDQSASRPQQSPGGYCAD